MQDLNLIVAFGAGVLTFVSPCTLPIYPAFLSYITGVSVTDLKNNQGMLQKRSTRASARANLLLQHRYFFSLLEKSSLSPI